MPNCDRHLASSAQLPLLSLRLWGQRHSWLCNSAVRREHHRPTTSNVSMKTEMLERQNAARVTDAPMWKKKVLKASGKRCRVCTSCTNYNNKNNAHTFFFTCPIQGCGSPEWSLLFTGPGWTFQSHWVLLLTSGSWSVGFWMFEQILTFWKTLIRHKNVTDLLM